MSLNIKNPEVVRLVDAIVAQTGETKTEAIRAALELRQRTLARKRADLPRGSRFLRYLEEEVWPNCSDAKLGIPLTKEEEEEILGFGPGGV